MILDANMMYVMELVLRGGLIRQQNMTKQNTRNKELLHGDDTKSIAVKTGCIEQPLCQVSSEPQQPGG